MLAIGIVVDDAIVVVENVERGIEDGLTPRDATLRAMREVSDPSSPSRWCSLGRVRAADLGARPSGQFLKQFAATITHQHADLAFNSLTLSPALAAIPLRPHDAPWGQTHARDGRRLRPLLPRLQPLLPTAASEAYGRGVTGILKRKSLAVAVYAVLLGLTSCCSRASPPALKARAPDKQYLIGVASCRPVPAWTARKK